MVEETPTHKVPLVGELPKPDDRVFNNNKSEVKTSKRKRAQLDVRFGELNAKNFE